MHYGYRINAICCTASIESSQNGQVNLRFRIFLDNSIQEKLNALYKVSKRAKRKISCAISGLAEACPPLVEDNNRALHLGNVLKI